MSTQTDPNAEYNAEVMRIAEILNNKYWEDSEDGIPPLDTEKDDPELWKQARAMVEEMYKVWTDCWQLTNPYTHQKEDGEHYAQKRGLIPNTKTDNDA